MNPPYNSTLITFNAVRHFFSSPRFNLFLALVVLLLLQWFCAYDFLYAEQFCFFRFSADCASSMLLRPCGTVEYAAQFLGQFYYYRWAGPAIASLLFYLTVEGFGILSRRRWPFISVAAALLVAVLETVVHYPMAATLSMLAGIWLTVVYLRIGRVWEGKLPAPWNRLQHLFRLLPYLALYFWMAGYGWGTESDALHTWTLNRYATSFLQVPAATHLLPICYAVTLALALSQHWEVWTRIDDWLARGRRWSGFSLRRMAVDLAQILLAFVLVSLYYVQTHPARAFAYMGTSRLCLLQEPGPCQPRQIGRKPQSLSAGRHRRAVDALARHPTAGRPPCRHLLGAGLTSHTQKLEKQNLPHRPVKFRKG